MLNDRGLSGFEVSKARLDFPQLRFNPVLPGLKTLEMFKNQVFDVFSHGLRITSKPRQWPALRARSCGTMELPCQNYRDSQNYRDRCNNPLIDAAL